MKSQLQRRPSRPQLAALLALYEKFSERCVQAGAPWSFIASACSEGTPPSVGRSEKKGAQANQLQLPLFSVATKREQRLAWASGVIGREISSFTELRCDEAALLIDTLKRALGQKVNPPLRRRPDRDLAQAYGTAGRRGHEPKEIQLVDDATLDLIAGLVLELGWNVDRFNAFLSSPSSPVRSGVIRTIAEANRVIWALKNMNRHQEKGFYRRKE